MPLDEFVKQDLYVRKRWRQVQFLADKFWCRWLCEYLPQLQERQKWLTPQSDVQRDDLVLHVEPTPRGTWPMGRVVDVHCNRLFHVYKQSNIALRMCNCPGRQKEPTWLNLVRWS